MNVFFITGLPRSRTAWLANFLSFGETICFHDVFRDLESVQSIKKLFNCVPAINVGNSDPANLAFQDQLHSFFPNAKWVVIRRNIEHSRQSSERAFGGRVNVEYFQTKMNELIAKRNPFIVDFEELDTEAALDIARYCVPNFRSPMARNIMLERLNVQIDPSFLKSELQRVKDSPLSRFIEPVEKE